MEGSGVLLSKGPPFFFGQVNCQYKLGDQWGLGLSQTMTAIEFS